MTEPTTDLRRLAPEVDREPLQRGHLAAFGRWRNRCRLVLLAVWLGCALTACTANPPATPRPTGESPPGPISQAPGVGLFLDHPGVYGVGMARLEETVADGRIPVAGLWLERQHGAELERVPHRIETTPDGHRQVVFVAETAWFLPDDLGDGRPLEAVSVRWADALDGGAQREPTGSPPTAPPSVEPGDETLDPVEARRILRIEEDVVRIPANLWQRETLDTLWYWSRLTQQSSSQLEVELGALADRAAGELGLEIAVRVLGWSRTQRPEGFARHRIDLFLNDEPIGELALDSNTPATLVLEDVPAALLRPGQNRLRLRVPTRYLPGVDPEDGSPDPFLDIVYLDWVEVRYGIDRVVGARGAPFETTVSQVPRWLPDRAGEEGVRLISPSGWVAQRESAGGWWIPPGEGAELWAWPEGRLDTPVALAPLTTGARTVPGESTYVMIAPSHLRETTERLADLHRGLGRSVAVVDLEAVVDDFGGERSPRAVRAFLDHQLERSRADGGRPRLRWVLLVGDGDWFEADDGPSGASDSEESAGRNQIPVWTFLSRHGPAVSDHYYARDPEDEAAPRFALGRLPVATRHELEEYIDKVAAWIASPPPEGPATMLALRDGSRGAERRQSRLIEALADAPVVVFEPVVDPARRAEGVPEFARDEVIKGFAQEPTLVYFGGHGSRFVWQLGDPKQPSDGSFFDLEDVARLEPTVRQPVAISISCATAPFDHPSAGSLGEAMVLGGERGVVGFLGSSAPLETPRIFGEALVRSLLEAETLGEALVAAKRQTGRTRVSYLYGLLGDPGLPLSAQQPAGPDGQ